mgnify:CR=1 FL=1
MILDDPVTDELGLASQAALGCRSCAFQCFNGDDVLGARRRERTLLLLVVRIVLLRLTAQFGPAVTPALSPPPSPCSYDPKLEK